MLMCIWGLWVFIFLFLKEETLLRDQGTLQKYSALEIFRLSKIMVTGVDLLNFPSRPFFSNNLRNQNGVVELDEFIDFVMYGKEVENLQGFKEASYI